MKILTALFIHAFLSFHLTAQAPPNSYPVVWYNLENLFDCTDDSSTVDELFTPNGDKHWTSYRYWNKIKNLSKAILAVTEWNTPALLGLCEIENEQVLKDLVYNSPLSGLKLKYIHQNSQDRRGIDVALLYNPEYFEPCNIHFLTLIHPKDSTWTTRDILYCKGLLGKADTLHCFVNHWPSKFGGAVKSEPKRLLAAQFLIKLCDSILEDNPNAAILAMGDFNETSTEPAVKYLENHNMEVLKMDDWHKGTHKYKGNWSQIDYFVISKALYNREKDNLQFINWKIGEVPFLLESDAAYSGKKPFRTYVGYQYHGGFSDHLPLVLYLGKK